MNNNYCTHRVGVFLTRECRKSSNLSTCTYCGKSACEKHFSVNHKKCIDCLPSSSSDSSTYDSSSSSSSSGSSRSSDPSWSGAGGQFSGGGSSGSWAGGTTAASAAAAATAQASDKEGFTDADYAAFDRVIAADEISKSSSYDS